MVGLQCTLPVYVCENAIKHECSFTAAANVHSFIQVEWHTVNAEFIGIYGNNLRQPATFGIDVLNLFHHNGGTSIV